MGCVFRAGDEVELVKEGAFGVVAGTNVTRGPRVIVRLALGEIRTVPPEMLRMRRAIKRPDCALTRRSSRGTNARNRSPYLQARDSQYTARFDGGCWPNPGGVGACACVIEKDGAEIYRKSLYLGRGYGQTCNVSEFHGILLILRWFLSNDRNAKVDVIGDSKIVIHRMRTRTLPTGTCRAPAMKCLEAAKALSNIRFRWEGRKSNMECDAMCDAIISEHTPHGSSEIRSTLPCWDI